MESGLTQFGIDELARQGVDVTGLTVGYPATDDMRRRLGIQDDVDPGALPDPVSAAQVAEGMATTLDPQAAALNAGSMDPAAVAGAMNAVPAAAPVTQEQLTAPKSGGLGDMLFGPQEATDQFSNLNRQQRMMLAFGAIKDAGFALQGKEGSAFSSTLKAINDQIDMGRKAQAAQAQQEALTSIMGPGEAAAGDIQAQIERLSRLAVANPNLAPGIAVRIKALQDQMQAEMGKEGRGRSAVSTLRDIDSIISMIDDDPTLTTGTWAWLTRGIPMSSAGKTQALVDSVVSSLALDSLKALKATGATMGALNQEELNLLKTELAKVDLATDPATVKTQLGKVQGHYRTLISDLYRGANDEDAARITAFLGLEERPSWAGGSSQPSATQREGETDAEFLKRMREGRG